MFMTAFITVLSAYLIGSISFAVIFSKAFIKKDIREIGSGNAGSTNVLRTGGILPGVLTFLCDVLKGFAASGIGYLIFSYIYNNLHDPSELYSPIMGAYLCGLFCVIGHIFPIFFNFRGGKGVAVSVGIMAVCSPISTGIGLLTFAIVLLVTKYVSLGSVTAVITTLCAAVITAMVFNRTATVFQVIIILLMGTIIIVKHIGNIKRLIKGEERKFKIG